MTLANLSGSFAILLSAFSIWPQVIRVYVKQSVEGVSGLAYLITLAGTMIWFTYALNTRSLPLLLANTNIEIATIALIVMLVHKRALPLWQPVTVFALTVAYCGILSAVAPSAVGITGVIVSTPSKLLVRQAFCPKCGALCAPSICWEFRLRRMHYWRQLALLGLFTVH